MKTEELKKVFASFAGMKVMVIGDVMLDAYLWGKVDRISPEAPVPVVACNKKDFRLGGAGNVIVNLHSLGAKPLLCSVIGDDENAFLINKILKDLNLECKGIVTDASRPTTVKTRIISGSQQLLRIDEETDQQLSSELEKAFIQHTVKIISDEKFDAIIFQDYDKGVMSEKLISAVIAIAKNKQIPVLVDPKRRLFHKYNGASLFKPNFKELCEGLKIDLSKDKHQDIFSAAKAFQELMNIDNLMITLSEKGIFISDAKQYWTMPAHELNIADVSGAGDTVISVAALCMAQKLKPFEIAAIANLAGGLVCEKVGVVPIDVHQLEKESMKIDWVGF